MFKISCRSGVIIVKFIHISLFSSVSVVACELVSVCCECHEGDFCGTRRSKRYTEMCILIRDIRG